MSYEYSSKSAEGSAILIEESPIGAYIQTEDSTGCLGIVIPTDERKAAAKALAGDEYHVVQASPVDDKFIAVERDEHANLLSELYKARNEVLKLRDHRDRLRQQLIDNANRPFTYDDTCPKCVAGSHITPPAQPDRPEPVVDRMLNTLEEADSALGEREQEDWRALARELVKRGVEVRDAD